MAKFALLIGVSEYQPELNPLPNALHDIQALQIILQDEKVSAFDEVTVLPNSGRQAMEEAIYHLFANRQKDDVVLLYFSGHGVRDAQSLALFFATPQTQITERKTVVTPTAVAANFLQEQMGRCRSERTVVILDCCYSGAFPKNLAIKGEDRVDVEVQLGGKGCAILTSSTATQSSRAAREASEGDERPLSLYTHYLVEGLRTGAADLDGDGRITAYELHQYTHEKVTEESPAMTPEFYPVREGHEIYLAKVRMGDPLLLYRREVRRLLSDEGAIDFMTGEFDEFERIFLDEFCLRWNIAKEVAVQIEKEVTEPLRQLHQKLRKYEDLYQKALKRGFPFSARIHQRLQDCQKLWGLRDEDITSIEARLKPKQPTTKPQPKAEEQKNTPPPPTPQPPQVPLRYQQLEKLLRAKEWRQADEETTKQMLEVANRISEGWLQAEDIDSFPCEDLRAIDQLWVHYSNGRFGFSVQKRIYQGLGGTREYAQDVWRAYGKAVGWRMGNSWLYYSSLNFSASAPEGHLPAPRPRGGSRERRRGGVFFSRVETFSRVTACRL
ncbi:MAG: GUN4 domain-containing protein [Cyanobacteria bacterium P01_G01_bin.54]